MDRSDGARERLDANSAGVNPAYGLRYGVNDSLELAGKLSPFSLELGAKLGLVDSRRMALAIAPRVTSAGPGAAVPPYFLRLPVLFTFQPSVWFAATPRLGLGYVVGPAYDGAATKVSGLSAPIAEAGVTLTFRLTSRVSLAADGSLVATVLNRDVLIPGGGLAVVFTPPSRPPP